MYLDIVLEDEELSMMLNCSKAMMIGRFSDPL